MKKDVGDTVCSAIQDQRRNTLVSESLKGQLQSNSLPWRCALHIKFNFLHLDFPHP